MAILGTNDTFVFFNCTFGGIKWISSECVSKEHIHRRNLAPCRYPEFIHVSDLAAECKIHKGWFKHSAFEIGPEELPVSIPQLQT